MFSIPLVKDIIVKQITIIIIVHYLCYSMVVSVVLDWLFGGGLLDYFRSFLAVYTFDR